MGCVIPFPHRPSRPLDDHAGTASSDKLRAVLEAMAQDAQDLGGGLRRALAVAVMTPDLSGLLPRLYDLLERVGQIAKAVGELHGRLADFGPRAAAMAVVDLVVQVDRLQLDTSAALLEALARSRPLDEAQ